MQPLHILSFQFTVSKLVAAAFFFATSFLYNSTNSTYVISSTECIKNHQLWQQYENINRVDRSSNTSTSRSGPTIVAQAISSKSNDEQQVDGIPPSPPRADTFQSHPFVPDSSLCTQSSPNTEHQLQISRILLAVYREIIVVELGLFPTEEGYVFEWFSYVWEEPVKYLQKVSTKTIQISYHIEWKMEY